MTYCRPNILAKKIYRIAAALFCLVVTNVGKAQQASMETEAKITSLIKQMTLEEKVNMMHASSSFTSGGIPPMRIPELVTSDGPHGVRPEHGHGPIKDIRLNGKVTFLLTRFIQQRNEAKD